jgi:hypothetical protein
MQWVILLLLVPAILVPVVLLWGFAGCAAFGAAPEPLSAPANLEAEGVDVTTIKLTWQGTPGQSPIYQVSRAGPGGGIAPINAGGEKPDTSFTDGPASGLKEAVTFFYQVQALPTGTDSSPMSVLSNMSQATTLPLAPSGLTATAQSETEIDLTWTNNSAVAIDFVLEHRSPPGTGNFTPIANLSTVQYSHTGLVAGSAHEYQVKATVVGLKNSQAATIPSAYSATAQATTTPGVTAFTTVFSSLLNTDQPNLGGICIVQKFDHSILSGSGQKVKITVAAASSGDLTIDRIYISNVAVGGNDYDSPPAGSSGGLTKVLDISVGDSPLTLSAGTSKTVGPISFALDNTRDLLIAFDINNAPGRSNIIRNPTVPGATTYAQIVVEAGVAKRTAGYGAVPGNLDLVEKIEVA